MKEGFRQSMAWLHTWSGLLVCWILLLVPRIIFYKNIVINQYDRVLSK